MCIILQKNPADHITDHLPFRSIRKQWTGERQRARLSERKGAEKVIFSGNCPYRFVWEQDVGGSNPFTPTKILTENRGYSLLSVDFYAVLVASVQLFERGIFFYAFCDLDFFTARFHVFVFSRWQPLSFLRLLRRLFFAAINRI